MGFGLVIIGYLSMFGALPVWFIYQSWSIYIAVLGGLIMLAGFCRLEEYNIYFKLMKYITIAYVLILLGFSVFLIPKYSGEILAVFDVVSKIIRIFFLFVFHFFMLTGILALAKEVDNIKVIKAAKRNIFLTYIFFASFVLELFNISEENLVLIAQFMVIFGFIYFAVTMITLYSCYMRITYEGHDEKVEAKIEEMQEKFKRKKKDKR